LGGSATGKKKGAVVEIEVTSSSKYLIILIRGITGARHIR
jgi:hypothetical protein